MSTTSFSYDDLNIQDILKEIDESSIDLQNSLESFHRDRENILKNQKLALARYEKELLEIDSANSAIGNFNPKTATVDHNIFKHLSLDQNVQYEIDLNNDNPDKPSERVLRAPIMLVDQNSYIEKNKRFTELEQTPVPSFDQKKKLREDMFFYLEDATIEETRLEIEIDQAKEKGDLKLVDELSDALFVLQRLNSERLVHLITEYQPQPISRTWGADPDYAKLSRQLVQLSDAYALPIDLSDQRRR